MENCSNNSDSSEKIRIAYYAANAIGVLGAGVLLVAMLCIKAFKTILQRLFIVAVAVTLVHDTCRLANVFLYRTDRDDDDDGSGSQDRACVLLALMLQWYHWCVYLSLSSVVACLLTIVYTYSQQGSAIVHRVRGSKRLQTLIEVGVNAGMLLAPWTLIWVPLIRDQYGFDGIVCAIVLSNNSCGSTAGDTIVHTFFNNAPKVILVIVSGVSAVGMSVMFCRMPAEMKEARKVIKKLAILMVIICTYFLVLNLQLIQLAVKGDFPGLRIFNVFWHHFLKFLILLGYLVAFHCSNLHDQILKLNKRISRGSGRDHENVDKKDRAEEYGTFQDSSRESEHSSTYFIPSHTKDFATSSKV